MALSDFIEKLPEADREAFKSEIGKVVLIGSREDAAKLLAENPFLKSERDAVISKTTENYKKKFETEDLPKLLEEERKKGEKKPWELEIEKLRQEQEQDRKALALERQKGRALSKLNELGLPVDLVSDFIGTTDEETDLKLEKLAGALKPWQDGIEKKIKAEFVGNNGNQKRGDPSKEAMKRSDFEKLTPADQMAKASKVELID